MEQEDQQRGDDDAPQLSGAITETSDPATAVSSLLSQLEDADFSAAFHGYDPQEVRALLASVAATLRELAPVASSAPQAAEPADRRVADSLAEMMVNTAEHIQATRDQAEGESARLLDDAHKQAAEIVRDAEVHSEASHASAQERLAAAQVELSEAEAFRKQMVTEAAKEADGVRRQAATEATAMREDGQRRAEEALAEAETQAEELRSEAQRIAEQTLQEAAEREADLNRLIRERAQQLETIELELGRMADMASELLNIGELLATRTARLRRQADELIRSDTGADEPARQPGEEPVPEPGVSEELI